MNTRYSSKNILTRQEAADRLKISLTTMSKLLKENRIYHLRFQREVRIPEEALDDYVNGRGPKPADDPMTAPDLGTWPSTPSMLGAEDETA